MFPRPTYLLKTCFKVHLGGPNTFSAGVWMSRGVSMFLSFCTSWLLIREGHPCSFAIQRRWFRNTADFARLLLGSRFQCAYVWLTTNQTPERSLHSYDIFHSFQLPSVLWRKNIEKTRNTHKVSVEYYQDLVINDDEILGHFLTQEQKDLFQHRAQSVSPNPPKQRVSLGQVKSHRIQVWYIYLDLHLTTKCN